MALIASSVNTGGKYFLINLLVPYLIMGIEPKTVQSKIEVKLCNAQLISSANIAP